MGSINLKDGETKLAEVENAFIYWIWCNSQVRVVKWNTSFQTFIQQRAPLPTYTEKKLFRRADPDSAYEHHMQSLINDLDENFLSSLELFP